MKHVRCEDSEGAEGYLDKGAIYAVQSEQDSCYSLREVHSVWHKGRFVDVVPDAPPAQVATPGTNPKDLLGIKKVQLNLVPASSVIYQALAMEDGARKYGPYNWRSNKVIASIYVAAALRHLAAWYDSGEENATDSGKPHLGHAMACIGIIIDAFETGNLVDDRPPPGVASNLIARFEKKDPPTLTKETA